MATGETKGPDGAGSSDTLPIVARHIKKFVENPFTKLAVGLILVITSSVETYFTFAEDLAHLRPRVHHGLLILGFVNILAAVPELIEGLERYLQFRENVRLGLPARGKKDEASS